MSHTVVLIKNSKVKLVMLIISMIEYTHIKKGLSTLESNTHMRKKTDYGGQTGCGLIAD